MVAKAGSNVGNFLLGFGIGAAIAILLAPKAGDETRAYLDNRIQEAKQYAQDTAVQLQKDTKELFDRGEKAVSREVERIYSSFDAGREAYWRSRANGSTTNT